MRSGSPGTRIVRGGNSFSQQIPHPDALELRAHARLDGGAPTQSRDPLPRLGFNVQPHQLFHPRRHALGQVGLGLGHLHVQRERLLENPHQPAPGLQLQPLPQFALHAFKQRRIGVRIEAAHPPPVAGKTHLSSRRLVLGRRFAQDHADVHILVPHRIRHIPEQSKLALSTMAFAVHIAASSC